MENTQDHPAHGLVAVYGDQAAADRAATALRSIGVDPSHIRTGGPSRGPGPRHDVDPLAADQAVDVDPEEVAATGAVSAAVAIPIGILLALPFALIPFGGWPLWLRALVVAIAGALAASVYAVVMSVPILTPRKPAPASATDADGGVVVHVDAYSSQIAQVVQNEKPVRVDVIDLTDRS